MEVNRTKTGMSAAAGDPSITIMNCGMRYPGDSGTNFAMLRNFSFPWKIFCISLAFQAPLLADIRYISTSLSANSWATIQGRDADGNRLRVYDPVNNKAFFGVSDPRDVSVAADSDLVHFSSVGAEASASAHQEVRAVYESANKGNIIFSGDQQVYTGRQGLIAIASDQTLNSIDESLSADQVLFRYTFRNVSPNKFFNISINYLLDYNDVDFGRDVNRYSVSVAYFGREIFRESLGDSLKGTIDYSIGAFGYFDLIIRNPASHYIGASNEKVANSYRDQFSFGIGVPAAALSPRSVPEPSNWMLFMAGLGSAGIVMRNRRRPARPDPGSTRTQPQML